MPPNSSSSSSSNSSLGSARFKDIDLPRLERKLSVSSNRAATVRLPTISREDVSQHYQSLSLTTSPTKVRFEEDDSSSIYQAEHPVYNPTFDHFDPGFDPFQEEEQEQEQQEKEKEKGKEEENLPTPVLDSSKKQLKRFMSFFKKSHHQPQQKLSDHQKAYNDVHKAAVSALNNDDHQGSISSSLIDDERIEVVSTSNSLVSPLFSPNFDDNETQPSGAFENIPVLSHPNYNLIEHANVTSGRTTHSSLFKIIPEDPEFATLARRLSQVKLEQVDSTMRDAYVPPLKELQQLNEEDPSLLDAETAVDILDREPLNLPELGTANTNSASATSVQPVVRRTLDTDVFDTCVNLDIERNTQARSRLVQMIKDNFSFVDHSQIGNFQNCTPSLEILTSMLEDIFTKKTKSLDDLKIQTMKLKVNTEEAEKRCEMAERQLRTLQDQNQLLKEQNDSLRKQSNSFRDQVRTTKDQLSSLKAQSSSLYTEISKLRHEQANINTNENLSNEACLVAQEITQIQDGNILVQIKELLTMYKDSVETSKLLNHRVNKQEHDHTREQLKLKRLNQQLTSLKEKNEFLNNESISWRKESEEKENQLQLYKNQVTDILSNNEELSLKIEFLSQTQKDLFDIQEEMLMIEAKIKDSDKQVQESRQQMRALEGEKEEAVEKLKVEQLESQRVKLRLSEADSKIIHLEESLSASTGEMKQLQDQLLKSQESLQNANKDFELELLSVNELVESKTQALNDTTTRIQECNKRIYTLEAELSEQAEKLKVSSKDYEDLQKRSTYLKRDCEHSYEENRTLRRKNLNSQYNINKINQELRTFGLELREKLVGVFDNLETLEACTTPDPEQNCDNLFLQIQDLHSFISEVVTILLKELKTLKQKHRDLSQRFQHQVKAYTSYESNLQNKIAAYEDFLLTKVPIKSSSMSTKTDILGRILEHYGIKNVSNNGRSGSFTEPSTATSL